MSPLRIQQPDDAIVEAFPVRVTLEDQLALQLRCLRSPVMQAGRWRREVLIVLSSPLWALGGLAIGIGGTALADGVPLREVLGFLRDDWPLLPAVLAIAAAATVAYLALARRMLRPRMRQLLRRVLKAQPGVDLADKTLSFTAEVSAGPDGLHTRNASGAISLSWAVLKRWEEAGGRLFVLGDAMTGLCLPTADVDPVRLDALRRLLAARLGPPGAGQPNRA